MANNIKNRLQQIPSSDREATDLQKVLIVDDNPAIIKLYSAYLKKDYFIDVAYNGMDAIQKLQKTPPHIIILDIMMPDLNGFAVVQKMRDLSINIPTIIVTAKQLDNNEKTLLEKLGVSTTFQKDDLTSDILLNKIKEYLATEN